MDKSVYDEAKWHKSGEFFPVNVPHSQAYVLYGFFIAWAIKNNLFSSEEKKASVSLEDVKTEKATGASFYENNLDGVFLHEDLNAEGQAFAQFYLSPSPGPVPYFIDYDSAFKGIDPYLVKDTWNNYQQIAPVISKSYENWKKSKSKAKLNNGLFFGFLILCVMILSALLKALATNN
jgi:hypothetical protein